MVVSIISEGSVRASIRPYVELDDATVWAKFGKVSPVIGSKPEACVYERIL